MTTQLTREDLRKIAVKFIVHAEGWYMCSTNWSKSYSAGVIEYTSELEAITAAKARINDEPGHHSLDIYAFNQFGERIQ